MLQRGAWYSLATISTEASNVLMPSGVILVVDRQNLRTWINVTLGSNMHSFAPMLSGNFLVAHAGLRRGLAGRPSRSPAASTQSPTVLRCRFEPPPRQGHWQRRWCGRRRRRPRRPRVFDAYAPGGKGGGRQVWVVASVTLQLRVTPTLIVHSRQKTAFLTGS